ncbi:hypothetical protein BC834DRAFT_545936 [Gloeopeniophorella convolvens]|nr:hypothetical protein BC834DRAFT_545936 [Gloeopeniophorella convolvens]
MGPQSGALVTSTIACCLAPSSALHHSRLALDNLYRHLPSVVDAASLMYFLPYPIMAAITDEFEAQRCVLYVRIITDRVHLVICGSPNSGSVDPGEILDAVLIV